MKSNDEASFRDKSIVRRLREGQRGQTFVLYAVAMVGIIGAAALVVDVGRAYYGYQQLLAQTRAAALAGGSVISNDGETVAEVESTATNYSGVTGDTNAPDSDLLTNVKVTVTPVCLTSAAATAEGVPACKTYSLGDNAIRVTETASVPTTFANVLGFPSWSISATALASAKGGFNGPYNVAIVVDTTSSMNNPDTGGNCSGSEITCALQGIRVLLNSLSPCPGGLTSCGATEASSFTVPAPASGTETGTNVENNPIDEVALFTFPGLAASGPSIGNVQDDIRCPTKNPPITSYNEYFDESNCTGSGTPVPCCTGSKEGKTCASVTNPPVYEIVPFSSDYRTSDTATSLNTSSALVIAAGGGCSSGLGAPGGEATFYAGAIDTAQSALATEAAARPNTKNVMIILTDGEANATTSEGMEAPTPAPSKVYSATGQCAQAVARAQAAAAAGTTVYAVGYGSESTGCTTDTGTYSSPVCTIQGMANSPTTPGSYVQSNQNFFLDASSTKAACAADARSVTSLDQIFQAISNDLTVSRLIPNSTT